MASGRPGTLLRCTRWDTHGGSDRDVSESSDADARHTRAPLHHAHRPRDQPWRHRPQLHCVWRRAAISDEHHRARDQRHTDQAVRELETKAVTLATGSRLGPYEIVAAIGAGGMGEVY